MCAIYNRCHCNTYFYLFIVYLMLLFSDSNYTASNKRLIVNDEFERIWNQAVVA
jgi:hypothetical protein